MRVKYLLLLAFSVVNALPTNGIRKQAWIGSTNCDKDLRKLTCIKKDGSKARIINKNINFNLRGDVHKPRSSICDIQSCRKCVNSDGDNKSDCSNCSNDLYNTPNLFKGYACMRIDVDIVGPDFELDPNEWAYPNDF